MCTYLIKTGQTDLQSFMHQLFYRLLFMFTVADQSAQAQTTPSSESRPTPCPSTWVPDSTYCVNYDHLSLIKGSRACVMRSTTASSRNALKRTFDACPPSTSSKRNPEVCSNAVMAKWQARYQCSTGDATYGVDTKKNSICRLPAPVIATKSTLSSILQCPPQEKSMSVVPGKPPVDFSYFHPCTTSIMKEKGKIICGKKPYQVLVWNRIKNAMCHIPAEIVNVTPFQLIQCPQDIYDTEFFQLLQAVEHVQFNIAQLDDCFEYNPLYLIGDRKNLRKPTKLPKIEELCMYKSNYVSWYIYKGSRLLCRYTERLPAHGQFKILPCSASYFTEHQILMSDLSRQNLSSSREKIVKKATHRRRKCILNLVIEGPLEKQAKLEATLEQPVKTWLNNSLDNLVEATQLFAKPFTTDEQHSTRMLRHRKHIVLRKLLQSDGRILTQYDIVVLRRNESVEEFTGELTERLKQNYRNFDGGGLYQIDSSSIRVSEVPYEATRVERKNMSYNTEDTLIAMIIIGGVCLLGLVALVTIIVRAAKPARSEHFRITTGGV